MGKIIMNGNAYGSVGSDVEANPQGTATDTLNTIGIDNVVYSIEGSGGSGGSIYKETILWSNSNGETAYPSSPVQVTLSQSIDDFDMIFIESAVENNPTYRNNNITPVSSIDKTGNVYFNNVNIGGHDYHVPTVSCEDDTHFTLRGYASANPMMFYKITGIRFGNSDISPIIYSTEEREIGVWEDNKPLYQKTIIVDSITHTGEIDVSSLNIDTVVKMNGIANYPDNQWVNFPFYHNDNYYVRVYYIIDGGGDISDNCIYFEVGNSARGVYTNGFLTLQYTKTTDVPGGGSYNTLGTPTVHYSTNEQVIGTWIDGSTIYQKTITQTLSATDTIIPNTSNVDRLVQAFGNLSDSNGAITYFPYTDGEDYASAYKHASNGIHMLCTSWFINNRPDLTLTIQYTKTSS